jgi:hypothetical protein
MRRGIPDASTAFRSIRITERNAFSRLAYHETEIAPKHCLLLLDSFALPAGERGAQTRSWFGLGDHELFALGGLYPHVPGSGGCFSVPRPTPTL